jgi:hypothetical protein
MRPPQISAVLALLLAEAAIHGLAPSAHAEPGKRVRLDYQRQDGADVCADAAAIQVGVAARLGYDPFDDKANESVRVPIRQAAHGLEARIEMDGPAGTPAAQRRLVSRQHDCKELAFSVELAISIAIDPAGAPPQGRASVDPQPVPQAGDATSPLPHIEPAREPPPTARPLTGEVGAGLVGSSHSAPSTSLGIRLGASLRGELLSLGIEARVDWPSSMSLQVGSVGTSLFTGSLVPCVRSTYAAFCALATAGVLHALGEGLVDAKSANFFYGAVGARVALNYPVNLRWSLALLGDAVAPLTQTKLTVDGAQVWSSPTLAFALGLGATAKIP